MIVYKVRYGLFNKPCHECCLFFETVSKLLQLWQLEETQMKVLHRDGFATADAAFSNGLKGIVSATRM